MGRTKGFKKDRMYITQNEWSTEWGGKTANADPATGRPFKALQYTHCNLSLQPWTDPVCTRDGTIYDVTSIMKWLKQHKVDPVSGAPMRAGDLVPLHFHRNTSGNFHCPITFKEFTDYTHMVAVRQSGNVYAWEAIERLNVQPKNWKELITGEPFTRADLITLQDPNDATKGNVQLFYHIKHGLSAETKRKDEASALLNDPLKNITLTSTSQSVFKELRAREEAELKRAKPEVSSPAPVPVSPKSVSGGVSSAAFTSSSFQPKIEKNVIPPAKKTVKKGYAALHTSMGDLNLELYCDLVPLTCENFLGHCARGDYNNVKFHRSIPNFMIQGGDPEGTGRGGTSIWGAKFSDEIVPSLKHEGEGVLSMANAGPNTNGSQFFITYKSAPHLNGKHSIFGKLVGGLDVLREMSKVPCDSDDRPVKDIVILSASVYADPFSAEEQRKEAEEQSAKERLAQEEREYGSWLSNPAAALHNAPAPTKATGKDSAGVGKYVAPSPSPTPQTQPSAQGGTLKRALELAPSSSEAAKKKARVDSKAQYGNFGNF